MVNWGTRWRRHSRGGEGQRGTGMEMRKMPREENMLVICEVFTGLRERMELHTRDDGTGFSAFNPDSFPSPLFI